jgi:CHAD domain-containing protein
MQEQISPEQVSPEQIFPPESKVDETETVRKTAARRKPLPRVRKTLGVKAIDAMAEAGRKILRFHFAHMLNHEKGTLLGEDIEELHDMRVATRRMRAAFDVFGQYLKPKAVKKHLKRLRTAGRALGRVRDLDVFMEKTREYLETLPDSERTGLAPLLNAWERKRAREREKLVSYLESGEYQQFKQDFNEFTSAPDESAIPISDTNPNPNLVRHVLPVLIYTRLASVRAYETLLANAAVEQLHALRIEFKKLRYAMEFFHEVLGKEAKDIINELKSLQDHLGALNDANVACQTLSEFIEEAEALQNALPLYERQSLEPIVEYLAAKHAERHNLMVAFPELWEHFNRRESLKNIALSISGLEKKKSFVSHLNIRQHDANTGLPNHRKLTENQIKTDQSEN